jgi:hypothetical protein
MTEDEMRSTREYKEGWDAYTPHYDNGGYWPPGMRSPKCPYASRPSSTGERALWYAGGNAAYGNSYQTNVEGLDGKWLWVESRLTPITNSSDHVQLDLFSDPS